MERKNQKFEFFSLFFLPFWTPLHTVMPNAPSAVDLDPLKGKPKSGRDWKKEHKRCAFLPCVGSEQGRATIADLGSSPPIV
jgi:hypothetical protein